ncbi:MAG: hypothetical protein J1F60_04130 [Oscillospiraceae bacterium]|nr:hypothetical protein [Oscillospiraceae bacterium]
MKKSVRKMITGAVIALLPVVILFVPGTLIFHLIKSSKEAAPLKEKGYYNPVSAGDCCLNVAKLGNEKGEHTIIAMAGLCS